MDRMTNSDTLPIRRATVADARTIAQIDVAGWQAAYRGILPDDFLDEMSISAREAALESRLQRDEGDRAPAWIAERGGAAIGFVSSGPPRDEDVPLPAAEIYAIYVLPDARRSGAGRALLTAAVDDWRARGVTTLTLWVLEGNAPACAFYEATGWRPDGARQQLEIARTSLTEIRYRLALAAPLPGSS